LALGLFETAGKYLLPDMSSIIFFLTMMAVLIWRPHGIMGRAP
jgi:branched-chain amino acid transport system permease protein